LLSIQDGAGLNAAVDNRAQVAGLGLETLITEPVTETQKK